MHAGQQESERPDNLDAARAGQHDASNGASGSLGIVERLIPTGGTGFVAVAHLSMSCIREHQARLLQQRLCGLAERCEGRLAVSLSDVEDLSSAGINAFLAVHSMCRRFERRLALFGLSPGLRSLFRLTHLDRTMVIAGDVNEAVESFSLRAARWWRPGRRRKAA